MAPAESAKPPNPPILHARERMHAILEGLLQISNFVGSVMLLDDILDRIVKITSQLMGVPVSSIYLLDDKERLVLRSNIGFEPELIGNVSFGMKEGIVGWVADTGQILSLEDATGDPRYTPHPSALEVGCLAYLCAPLRIQEQIIGAMTLRKKVHYHFTRDEIILFEMICKQVAIVIEKSRMYEQMIQVERLAAVAVSLTGVAHYIKNILLTMQGGEYLVEQEIKSQRQLEPAREGWEVLKRANRKIRKLVENILNYCRQTEPDFRPTLLNAMILDLIQSLEETARERGVVVEAELDESIREIWIDPDIFHDALLNLVINGMDAIPDSRPGKVRIITKQLSGRNQVLIEISDSGVGIPDEIRDKIFHLFFTTKGPMGTGIGLAAVRKTIEAHGGTIELAPYVKGLGADFKIYLPINPPEKPRIIN